MTPSKHEALVALFKQTGHAHHEAFSDVDGADPEWPAWYAGYLADKLPTLLDKPMSEDEILVWIEAAHAAHQTAAPDSAWPVFYAEHLTDSL